jgi:hypothetical protein
VTTEACMLALKSTLEEIKSVCPEVSNTFIFKSDQTIIAKDGTTQETTLAEDSVKAFSILTDKTQTAGGLESATFLGTDSQVKITRVNNMYFALVAYRGADEKILTVISRILAPAILKTMQAVDPTLDSTSETASHYVHEIKITDEINQAQTIEDTQQIQPNNDPYLPSAPVTQFIVETLHGMNRFISSPDYVRVDSKTIETWKSMFGDKKIEEVQIEDTRTGKKQTFKFKPLKDDKLEGKGIIQIPEKAQAALKTKKGALVMVKPIIK